MKLRSFHGYEGLTKEEKDKICNGAGAAGDWRSAFIPNSIWGLSLLEAFNRHDYDYSIGNTIEGKWDADINLLINCIILILRENSNMFLTYARMARAIKYFMAVHYEGDVAFYKS